MVKIAYDPEVIHSFAARLYRRAASIVATYALMGALLGLLAGLAMSAYVRAETRSADAGQYALWFTLLIGIGSGYAIGSEKAFGLRLQAQSALCQVQIELNTAAVRAALCRSAG